MLQGHYSSSLPAIVACGVVLFILLAVGAAKSYQSQNLEKRYRAGPWASALVISISRTDSKKYRSVRYHRATVEFPNTIDGLERMCVGSIDLGTDGTIKQGQRLRIAPLEGTCGNIASAFD